MTTARNQTSTNPQDRHGRTGNSNTRQRGAGLFHPDLLVGGLSRVFWANARPVADTLGDLDVYRNRAVDELFPAPHETPHPTITSRWRLPGLVSENLTFRSLHEPLEPKFRRRYEEQYRATHTVFARRIRPATAQRRPRLLYLNGYMQPETYVEEFTLLTSIAIGLNVEVIEVQAPHHGRRASRESRFSGELYWTADLVRSMEALRQTVLDVRTLLHWLQEQDDRPVGVAGLSLGGALSCTLACLEERFAFAIPLIAHMDLAALVSNAPVLVKMRRDLKSLGWGRQEFNQFAEQIGWNDLQPKLSPEQLLIIAASDDRFFAPRLVEEMWQRWGKPRIHWFPGSHMGFLPHALPAMRSIRRFIDERVS